MKDLHKSPSLAPMTLFDSYRYARGYISYRDIELDGLPKSIELEGQSLQLKDEFHITLIDTSYAANVITPDNPATAEVKIVDDFKEFIKHSKVGKFRILNEFRFVEKEDLKTVIVMCALPGADNYFEMLSKKYAATIPLQPFHITLYTLPFKSGIGISSNDELAEISVELKLPQLKDLKPAK